VSAGQLTITATKMDAAHVASCGQNRTTYSSGLITTQPSPAPLNPIARPGFTQTYGYFEMDAALPTTSGTWPAFWLLPVTNTGKYGNSGNLSEIDVVEVMNGKVFLNSNGQYGFDNTGVVKSTLHNFTYDANGNVVLNPATPANIANGTANTPVKASTGGKINVPELGYSSAPLIYVTPDTITPAPTVTPTMHTYGVLWDTQNLVFFFDRKEIFRTPNVGGKINDPHYMIANLAVAGGPLTAALGTNGQPLLDKKGRVIYVSSNMAAGDPALGQYPAKMTINYIKAWQIQPTDGTSVPAPVAVVAPTPAPVVASTPAPASAPVVSTPAPAATVASTPALAPAPKPDAQVVQATAQIQSIIDDMKTVYGGKKLPYSTYNADITPLVMKTGVIPTEMLKGSYTANNPWGKKTIVMVGGGKGYTGSNYIISYYMSDPNECKSLAEQLVLLSGHEKPTWVMFEGNPSKEVTSLTPDQINALPLKTCTNVLSFFDTSK
jgi:hypothetical protein